MNTVAIAHLQFTIAVEIDLLRLRCGGGFGSFPVGGSPLGGQKSPGGAPSSFQGI
jgi:hypothetical protein